MLQIRSSPRISSRFWSGVLPKPKPGSRQTCSSGIPAADRGREPLLEEGRHLPDDVVVPRLDLHRARLSLHVHEADVRSGVRDHARERRIRPQRGDVVHERGPELERAPRDLGLRRVDRDGQAREPFEHGHDAPQLLVERDAAGPGTRRLAADVDERRSLGEHRFAAADRALRFDIVPAVGEAVGRHVDAPPSPRDAANTPRGTDVSRDDGG